MGVTPTLPGWVLGLFLVPTSESRHDGLYIDLKRPNLRIVRCKQGTFKSAEKGFYLEVLLLQKKKKKMLQKKRLGDTAYEG